MKGWMDGSPGSANDHKRLEHGRLEMYDYIIHTKIFFESCLTSRNSFAHITNHICQYSDPTHFIFSYLHPRRIYLDTETGKTPLKASLKCRTAVAMEAGAAEGTEGQVVAIQMGTIIIPETTLVRNQEIETIQHPIPTGMKIHGLVLESVICNIPITPFPFCTSATSLRIELFCLQSRELTDIVSSYGGSNGYSGAGSNGHANGHSNGYGASTNGFGGGGYGGFGGGAGDKMSNLGAGLKQQTWGKSAG